MGDFNQDELFAPSWLNEGFFKEILIANSKDKSIMVRDVKITPGSGKGDHYASVMFRATIVYDSDKTKESSTSMIIKTMPESDGLKKELIGESRIFETEIGMYSQTIPKFEAELRKIGDKTVLGAKVLYYSLEPRKCIIFEDIVLRGYETLRDRLATLDEAKGALLKLAKWHAVSYKLANEGDKSVTAYQDGLFELNDIENQPFMTSGIENFINKIETIDELKRFSPKLRLIQKDLLKLCKRSFHSFREDSHKGIFVLCHGDFHAKNLMVKRKPNGELEDVIWIFNCVILVRRAVLDIIYSLYVLLDEDLRRNKRDELIYYYCSNFTETLEKLKFKGKYPKVADFYMDIIHHRHFELFIFTSFLPFWYGIVCGNKDVEEMMNSDDFRRKLYDCPEFVTEVKRLLPIMANNGYLD